MWVIVLSFLFIVKMIWVPGLGNYPKTKIKRHFDGKGEIGMFQIHPTYVRNIVFTFNACHSCSLIPTGLHHVYSVQLARRDHAILYLRYCRAHRIRIVIINSRKKLGLKRSVEFCIQIFNSTRHGKSFRCRFIEQYIKLFIYKNWINLRTPFTIHVFTIL